MKLKKNKEEFFDLVKQQNVTDRLDVYTLNHFQKVRAICRHRTTNKI